MQKEEAVEHYLNHGRCIAATARALGYPSRELFRNWIRELYPELRKCVVGDVGTHPRPPELKQAAVIALCTRQGKADDSAQDLAVSSPTPNNWKNRILSPEAPPSMKRQSNPPAVPDKAQSAQQIESLKSDPRWLQHEHDLLK